MTPFIWRFLLKRFPTCFNLFVLLFIVTPRLTLAVQPFMAWILIKKLWNSNFSQHLLGAPYVLLNLMLQKQHSSSLLEMVTLLTEYSLNKAKVYPSMYNKINVVVWITQTSNSQYGFYWRYTILLVEELKWSHIKNMCNQVYLKVSAKSLCLISSQNEQISCYQLIQRHQ